MVDLKKTKRGFNYADPIEISGPGGGRVTVHTSSNAEGPHLWLEVSRDKKTQAIVQLSDQAARDLRDALNDLLKNHYQGDCS